MKADILQRVARVTVGLRHVVVQARALPSNSPFVGREARDLERELEALEDELGLAVDEFMAGRYMKHNAQLRAAMGTLGDYRRERSMQAVAARPSAEAAVERARRDRLYAAKIRDRHAKHEAVFGPFKSCGHHECVRARTISESSSLTS